MILRPSILLLLTLQFVLIEAPPSNKDGPSDSKKAKNVCFFGTEHTSPLEKILRPTRSKVSASCDGSHTELSSLAANPGSLGAPSELALLLARASGVFLGKDDDISPWKGKTICERHLRELSRDYEHAEFKHHALSNTHKPRCGYPQPNHHRNAVPWATLSYEQSKALLDSQQFLLQPGTALCREHAEMIRTLVSPTDTDDLMETGQCRADVEDPSFSLQERKPPVSVDPIRALFLAFARGAGVKKVECRKEYSELSYRGKRYRLHAATVLSNIIIEMLAESEEDQEELRAAIKASIVGRIPTLEDSKLITDLLTTAAENYREAKNAQERIHLLSLYAKDIPYRLMVEYVDGLSERLWNQAKKRAIDKKSYVQPDHSKERYCPTKVNFFVSFVTSPHLLVGLPWGLKKTKDSKGKEVELPNMIRRTSIFESIRLYEKYMDDSGRSDLKLSNATTYRILSRLPMMKSRAISCVDFFEAAVSRALIDIATMLDQLESMSLMDHSEVTGYKNSFHQIKAYLNGNFKLHAKKQSYFSDHCLQWSLSDPKNGNLVAPHNHVHQRRCQECKGIDDVIDELRKSLAQFKKDATGANEKKLAEFAVEYEANVEKIYDLKAHNARSVFASLERERLIASLTENQCLITNDFSQKWLPAYYRESQTMYFGKKGLSLHIAHCLCNITGRSVQHSVAHLLNEQEQNSTIVAAVFNHTLSHLKTMGVTEVHLRSDNAAYYKSSALISSIPRLSDVTGVQVLSVSYSEAQSGKSSSDRVAALIKRKMRNHISKENDVSNVMEMFTAINATKQLQGVSVFIMDVHHKEAPLSKIPKISDYYHFSFSPSFTMAYRFYGIGRGVQLTGLKPIQATYTIVKSGGKLASEEVNKADREALAANISPEFWFSPPEHPIHHYHHHEPNDSDDEEATGHPSVHNLAAAPRESLYFCRECGASFIRYANLIKHINSNRHKIRPDRVTLFDKALGLFKRALEDVQQDLTLTPLNEAIRQIRQGNDEPLPMGWAIRKGKKGGRLPEKARALVVKLFNERSENGQKLREEEAWIHMKADDSIAPEDRLSREQIKNLINTMAQKLKKPKTRATRALIVTDEDEEWEDVEDDGVPYEEVEVDNEDILLTDDDIHQNIIDSLKDHFEKPFEPLFADHNIGIDDFE